MQSINWIMDFGAKQWGNLILAFLILYGCRNLYYLFWKREKLKSYAVMSILTFWAVIILPILNYCLRVLELNYISSVDLALLVTACLWVKVSIAIIRIEILPDSGCLTNNKQSLFSILILLYFMIHYLALNLLDEKIRGILTDPYLVYAGYLCYHYDKK